LPPKDRLGCTRCRPWRGYLRRRDGWHGNRSKWLTLSSLQDEAGQLDTNSRDAPRLRQGWAPVITRNKPHQSFSTLHPTKLFHHSSSRTKLFTTLTLYLVGCCAFHFHSLAPCRHSYAYFLRLLPMPASYTCFLRLLPTPTTYACWCSLLLSVSPFHFACYAYLPPSYQPPWITPSRPARQSPQSRR
jgi:hypothetical protein